MSKVAVSLGSNKGNRYKNLWTSLDLLVSENFDSFKISSIYKTDPVDDEDQPYFYNAVISFETSLSPFDLLSILKQVEVRIGKEKERAKGPRRIDIDILFYDNITFKNENLIIPHPSIQKRLFVLKPLMEIMPFYIHPSLKKSIRELYFEVEDNKTVKYEKPFIKIDKQISEEKGDLKD